MKTFKILSIYLGLTYFLSILIISFSSSKINSILKPYVNFEAERITTNVIKSVANSVVDKHFDEEIFKITRNNDNEIEMIDYNSKIINKLLSQVNKKIYRKLLNLDNGNIEKYNLSSSVNGAKYSFKDQGLVCEIPLGSLTGNSFISNLGPVIPLKMTFLGSVNSYIKTKTTNYGFNNLFLEISIRVEVKEKISLPTSSKVSTVFFDVPISMQVISGKIPNYYGGIIDSNSSMSFYSYK